MREQTLELWVRRKFIELRVKEYSYLIARNQIDLKKVKKCRIFKLSIVLKIRTTEIRIDSQILSIDFTLGQLRVALLCATQNALLFYQFKCFFNTLFSLTKREETPHNSFSIELEFY